jgi:hypothetical protein
MNWAPLDTGTNGFVTAFSTFDDGGELGSDLYAAGGMTHAGTADAWNLAEWHDCDGTGMAFCFGDGTNGPCPCGNSGSTRHGCQNSMGTGGGVLYAAGGTQPDTLVLSVLYEMPSALSIFLQGNAEIVPTGFGDGLRCTGGALKRLFVRSASGGSTFAPPPGGPSISARSAALGDPIAPGSVRIYQTYYRDASPAFCPTPPGSTFNATNGLRVQW